MPAAALLASPTLLFYSRYKGHRRWVFIGEMTSSLTRCFLKAQTCMRVLSEYSELSGIRNSILSLSATRYSHSQSRRTSDVTFDPPHINTAALESGLTKYYCNRNPRSLELLGVAEKPKGFQTKNQRVDYYHRLI